MDVFPTYAEANEHLEPVIKCSPLITSSVVKTTQTNWVFVECMFEYILLMELDTNKIICFGAEIFFIPGAQVFPLNMLKKKKNTI